MIWNDLKFLYEKEYMKKLGIFWLEKKDIRDGE